MLAVKVDEILGTKRVESSVADAESTFMTAMARFIACDAFACAKSAESLAHLRHFDITRDALRTRSSLFCYSK